ncbi:hypothetical protein [Bacillus multifaciens]|uniref:hypothetical protein n=1 Tax=Bacillus multifaciens TaxID=3068506 RepID=UPI0027403F8A|nr:hypothetical protein [Bacillus sp. WLY-B-L8]MDP7977487.1 hypothetical protein [Bacillus sp. WLY-B-L8]
MYALILGLLVVGVIFTTIPIYRAIQEVKQEKSVADKWKLGFGFIIDMCIMNPLSGLFFSLMIGIPALLGGIILILLIVLDISI